MSTTGPWTDNRRTLLRERVRALEALASPCTLCPRQCNVRRDQGKLGACGVPAGFRLASANLHRGEEPPISGTRGSGTIFTSGCPLHCKYCQNYPISQLRHGRDLTDTELAAEMLTLQRRGAHNLNFVTPTHYVARLFAAVSLALEDGLMLPIVYNTSGYERLEVLRLLDGLVDVYLPDIRYADNEVAMRLSGVGDYVENNRAAIREMHRQVGHLQVDDAGIAVRGLIVRHLVLPDGQAGSHDSLTWLVSEVGRTVSISLMSQYFPAHQAPQIPGLDRGVTLAEYGEVLDLAEELHLENALAQDPDASGGA